MQRQRANKVGFMALNCCKLYCIEYDVIHPVQDIWFILYLVAMQAKYKATSMKL